MPNDYENGKEVFRQGGDFSNLGLNGASGWFAEQQRQESQRQQAAEQQRQQAEHARNMNKQS